MSHVILIAGLGFGDEGKGSMVDYYTRQAKNPAIIVRYSGGAQCAHNVVLPDGTHHTFCQFGSGTLAGAKTLLSRHMLVNPLNMENEAAALQETTGRNPYHSLALEEGALVTNLFQVLANRMREFSRGSGRHGSCGLGIGETMEDHQNHPEMSIRVEDLQDRAALRRKLNFFREMKLEEFREVLDLEEFQHFHSHMTVKAGFDRLVNRYLAFANNPYEIVDSKYLGEVLQENQTVIFEGAQGVLLDQDYGFFPHVTRSSTTFKNAEELLSEHTTGYSITRVGLLRGYMTRHGAGPFPSEKNLEDLQITPDQHNDTGAYQGVFRYGDFDFVLADYALRAIGGVDELVLTNLDRFQNRARACVGYHFHDRVCDQLPLPTNREEQEALTETLKSITLDYGVIYNSSAKLVEAVSELCPINLISTGPTYQDKVATSEVAEGIKSWN